MQNQNQKATTIAIVILVVISACRLVILPQVDGLKETASYHAVSFFLFGVLLTILTAVLIFKTLSANYKKILQNRQQLEEAQRIARIGSWEWDIKTGKEVWSDELFKVFGYVSGEVAPSHDFFLTLIHHDDKDAVLAATKNALNGTKPFDTVYRIILQTRILKFVHARGVVYRDRQGNPIKMIGTAQDITSQVMLEQKLIAANTELELRVNERTNELNMLLEHIQSSREDERKYIAREIHDELGQSLTALKIDAAMMKKNLHKNDSLNVEYASQELAAIITKIDGSINSVKRIATDLRPEILDHLDIEESVKFQVQQFENITGVPCKLTISMPGVEILSPDVSTTVYRIIQESITNITRHARARHVSILLRNYKNELIVEIADDGQGFDEQAVKKGKSLGLIGMRERIRLLHGSFFITTQPGKGTTIMVKIPLKEEED